MSNRYDPPSYRRHSSERRGYSSMMPTSREFYDEDQLFAKPTGPWSCGDVPRQGTPHLEIYVAGEKHLRRERERCDRLSFSLSVGEFEAMAKVSYHKGPYEIDDPQGKRAKVMG